MPLLKVENQKVPYEIVRHARARSIIISAGPKGIRLTVPKHRSVGAARKFIQSKKGWVLEEYLKASKIRQSLNSRINSDGHIPFLGRDVPAEVVWDVAEAVGIDFDGEKVCATLPFGTDKDEREELFQHAMKQWYGEQARIILSRRVDYFATLMGLEYGKVAVRDQRTRWGSCSGRGTLSFNWRLVLAPEDVLDYLVVHELAHLRYLSHRVRFRSLVRKWAPHIDESEKWLRENYDLLWILT